MTKIVWLYAIYKFFKIVIPWLFRVAWFTIKLMFLAMGGWIMNIPKNIKAIARNWSDRANVAGVPSEYDTVLYYGSGFIALVMTVLGWVISAYVTVWLIGQIF
jgi:hypothetical protein